jgi:hypothetical protein
MPEFDDVNEKWLQSVNLYEQKYSEFEKIVYERSIKK